MTLIELIKFILNLKITTILEFIIIVSGIWLFAAIIWGKLMDWGIEDIIIEWVRKKGEKTKTDA